ncbi:tripartite tricarboxylate transporter TctB family protein [Rhodococcoides kyotonense]|uniref:Putative tricarboxylic transport membrane protein n=1 Tax=Rhodococcoides kyotonense TaxID=398843 RepID=A0A239DWG1_9NOCA|nr:tripartite tricarboxylate transporter TctB family protein [Rhodococcus kyotonensis]SNS36579.1 putative tricarboxylic transport membrane protein [Rhodococcus kyotonensis]
MSTTTEVPRSFWTGRSGLIVPALLVALGVFLVYGTVTMDVPATATSPGPQVFPSIVAGGCFIVAILVTGQLLMKPDIVDRGTDEDGTPNTGTVSNWRTLGITVGSVALFIVLLDPLGWVLAGALLFWGVSIGLGSRRYVFDGAIALLVSSAVQLAFSAGLGLTLPGGLLAQVF